MIFSYTFEKEVLLKNPILGAFESDHLKIWEIKRVFLIISGASLAFHEHFTLDRVELVHHEWHSYYES